MAIDLGTLQQEFTRIGTQGGGSSNFLDNFVPMPEGEGSIVLRLLPPTEGLNGLPCARTRTHKLNNKTFHSPLQLVNGKWLGNCPINNYYRSLWKQSETASAEEAKALQAEARSIKPVERYYFNAIIRSATSKSGETLHNVGPKIYSCGKQVWEKILRAIIGAPEVDEPGLGDITDLHTGRDFKIIKRLVKSGSEAYPNYTESKFLAPSAAGTEADIAAWMANRHNLASLITVKTFDELAKEVRVHRGLEKDPDLAFDGGTPTPVVETRAQPQAPRNVAPQRPVVAPQPVAAVNDDEDFGVGDEFFQKLRNL
jgi:hypothetical protein